jgi:hypothetical protein
MLLICILVPMPVCTFNIPLLDFSLSILLPSVSGRQTDFLLLDLLLLFNVITLPVFLLHTVTTFALLFLSCPSPFYNSVYVRGRNICSPGSMWPYKMFRFLNKRDETNLRLDRAQKISFRTGRILDCNFMECTHF